jgi:TolB-like protein/class 3 adenylate cyclase/Tfp pilus assembly protein PilF
MTDRRLAAVMVTDMVGFTVLMGADQDHAVDLLNRGHEFLKAIVEQHKGEWLEDASDRSLTAFPSAINAINCALEIQEKLKDDPELKLRIGVDVGDILVSRGHVYGDAVNIASFIERLADPEGLVITQPVYESVREHIDLNVIDLGEKMLKNIGHSVRLYALTGVKQRHKAVNFLTSMTARRVPHITGAYLAASWALVEVVEWLAKQGAFSLLWVYGMVTGLLVLVPSVILVTYSHGAHGRERLTAAEKIGVPLNLIIAALVIGVVLREIEVPQPVAALEPASVAVLPFVNLDAEEGDDYFSLGLSEELINALAKVPGLYVASRTSSFVFDNKVDDPREIAQKLRVATILEGSVRKQGDNVRVTAQLIDGTNNFHLWSETYDREMADIFQIQEEIATAVAVELVGVLKPDVFQFFAEANAATLGVYDFYLRGLNYLRQPATEDSLESARSLFERALEDDPDYAQAYAALCEVSLQEYLLYRAPSHIDVAESDCRKALELDSGARDVTFALGELYRATGEFDRSEETFNELLQRRPTPRALVGFAQTKVAQGEFAAAESAFRSAIDREPGNWHHSVDFARFLYRRGRYEEALEFLERVIELSPDNSEAYLLMGACQDYLGDTDASLAATLKSIELSPSRAGYRDLGLTYLSMGEYELAVEAYEQAVGLGPDDHYSWSSLAHAYGLLGNREEDSRLAYERATTAAEAVLRRNPRDWITLSRLAVYDVMTGATELGLTRIKTAVAEGAHLSDVHYHDAVIRVHLGQQEQTLDAIERAIATGSPIRMIANDPRFVDLHDNERYQELIGE